MNVQPPAPARRDRRPVTALLAASILAQLGRQLSLVALPWFVLTTTGSAAKAGLVGFVVFLPGLAVGIFGGALIDRLGYRRVGILANLVSAFGIVLVPLTYVTVGLQFWQLLLFVFIGSLLEIPAITAGRSMVPELSTRAGLSLERVNAAFESSGNLALLLGTPFAGLLVAVLGAQNVLWFDAAASTTAALLLAVLIPGRLFPATRRVVSGSYMADLLAGLRFIRRDRLLWPMVIVLALSNAVGGSMTGVILPVYVRNAFGSAASLGLMIAAMGAGGFLGATIYGVIAGRIPRRWLWLAGFVSMPLEYAVFLLHPGVVAIMAVFLVVGIATGPINPLMVTIRHERSPEAIRGRVFSTYSAVAMAAQPLGVLVAGNLVEGVGFRPAVLALAVYGLLLAAAILGIPAFRHMDGLQPSAPNQVEPAASLPR